MKMDLNYHQGMESLGERLKALRIENGKKADQVALMLGVSVKAVYAWEAGEYFPGLKSLIRISEIFGASLDWIIKGNPPQ